MELHILLAGVEFGPYSEDKARQLLDEGFLSASDPAKRLDEADWLPLSELLGVAPSADAPTPDFSALAATLDEEPREEFHAPLPAGSEIAEAPVDEPPAAVAEIHEPEPEPAPRAETRRPDLTVSRPTPPVFRATMPIPTRPATTSLPPPRLGVESKPATQSLPKTKTRRLAESDPTRLSTTQSLLKPATPEIKSSFAAALAKTRSMSTGDTAPLPAPARSSTPLTVPKRPEPVTKPAGPALAPKPAASTAARVTSPIRAASPSTTATSPLIPVAAAPPAKKPSVTGSLLVKEALIRARDRTGVLGARMTSSLAPAADFEPEPVVARKRKPVVLANQETLPEPEPEPAPPRRAIRLTGRISMAGGPANIETPARPAPPLPDKSVSEVSPPAPAPEPAKPEPAATTSATTPEDAPAKPGQRKAIKLSGPISLPGRATQPTPPAPLAPGTAETTPLTGLLARTNRRGVALASTKGSPKMPARTAESKPPLVHPAEVAAAAVEAEKPDEPELTSSGRLISSGSLKISGALRQPPPPRTPIRLSSSSGEEMADVTDVAGKPAPPVPEEELTNRAPTGKIPLHEFPAEGVRVRTTRRLTSKVPLPTSPNEAITSESPQRGPPPLPQKIEPPSEPVPAPAPVFVEPPVEEPAAIEEPAVDPVSEPYTAPASEPEAPSTPPETTKPEKVRLRRPVKLELSSRKINDSGRLTLEAFSKMASLPGAAAEAEPAVATPEPEAVPGAAQYGAPKLVEAPPLAWAPTSPRAKPGLEWIFYGIIVIGFIAMGIIAFLLFHHSTSAAATAPETADVLSNPPPASPDSNPIAVPPATAAPPAAASVPATTPAPPASTPPPATATPPAAVTPAAPPPATDTNTPAASPAPVPPPSSPTQDAARQASAFVSDGILKYQQGNFDDAIAAYNQALTIDPKSTEAFFNRGIAKAAHDDLDGAVADYSQALDIDPNLGPAYYYRGLARHSKAELDGAISDYNDAVRINPKNALAFFNRGLIRMQKDDIDGAIVDSTRALELDPTQIQSYYNRGLGRMAKGAADGALNDMKTFTQLAPQDAYTDYARLYTWLMETQQGQLAEANKELADAMNKGWNGKPDDMVTRIGEFLLGQISEGDLVKASASAIPLKDQGQRCEAWYFIGMRKLEAGDKDGAADALRKCVDTQKTDYCEFILAQEALRKIGAASDSSTPIPPRAPPASLPDPGTMAPAPH